MDEWRGYTPAMIRLAEEFGRLPGIGRKTAERLTYHILKSSREDALRLATAIREVKEKVRACRECCNIAEEDLCAICADPRRDRSQLCVVEQPRDVLALEASGSYRGLYHVLMGHLNPLEGVEPEHLTIAALVERVRRGGVREVILATNPNLEGDATALFLTRELRPLGVRLTRLARGLPTGSSLEYASPNILADALSGRREIDAETTP